jgi:hypothetical protein
MQEGTPEFAAAHERHLAGYRSSVVEVYCHNRECERYGEAITVGYEEEYGQGWTTPEHCECGDDWSFDPTPLDEEEM